ncbi:MAG TPA: zf-HC2 domain-containing protein [Bryobacteraceae bacterium]|nr:zf-HC2 domain-containing protein [Bryobacteraceae bacterium]
MNCADLEILLCDYTDGTLQPDLRAEFDTHVAQCAACAELARDVSAALGFIERVPPVEPPPELMTRILFELPAAHQARAKKPGGIRHLIQEWIQPIMQPRFAMGFAMTILSFSLLARFAGISPRQLTVNDLRPSNVVAAVDDRIYRVWQRTVKYYENIRLVYEVQTQLREWTAGDEGPRAAEEPQQKSGSGATAIEQRKPEQQQPAQKQPGTSNENLRSGKQEK